MPQRALIDPFFKFFKFKLLVQVCRWLECQPGTVLYTGLLPQWPAGRWHCYTVEPLRMDVFLRFSLSCVILIKNVIIFKMWVMYLCLCPLFFLFRGFGGFPKRKTEPVLFSQTTAHTAVSINLHYFAFSRKQSKTYSINFQIGVSCHLAFCCTFATLISKKTAVSN